MSVIEVTDVKKYYGDVHALDGVSINVEKGKIYGLLGPNGAGKTTLVRALATLLDFDSGTINVNGINVVEQPNEVRRMIGLAGQFAAVDDFLTGRETLEMVARLYHVPKVEAQKRATELLERLSLADAADRTAKTYSGGMRRRLDLGASLVGRPEILFLDEPTTGLDPRTRQELWDLIRELVDEGRTLLLTTQYLEEADALCDYISILDRGKVVREGTADGLKKSLGRDVIEVHVAEIDQDKAAQIMQKVSDSKPDIDKTTKSISVRATAGTKTLLAIVNELENANVAIEDVAIHKPSLDDVFLSVTGKKASDVAKKDEKKKRGRR